MMGTKTKQIMRTAVLMGAFTFASIMPLCAQKLDTAKTAPKNDSALVQKQDTAVKKEKKAEFKVQPNAILRMYGNSQSIAVGGGTDLSLDIGKVHLGAGAKLVFDGKKLLVEESGVKVGISAGKTYVQAYEYTNLFCGVDAKNPAFGVLAIHQPFIAGIERGTNFTFEFAGVALSKDISVSIVSLEPSGKAGYFVPVGTLQMAGGLLGIDSKLFGKTLKLQAILLVPVHGGENAMNIQLVYGL